MPLNVYYDEFQPSWEEEGLFARDVNGQLVGIRTTDYPDISPFEAEQGVKADPKRHVADQVALRAMVDSIEIAR